MNAKDPNAQLLASLLYLKLPWMRENFEPLAKEAAAKHWGHVEFLCRLVEGETNARMDRATERRIKAAAFPLLKTIEGFDWSWPKRINRAQIQDLFRLSFLEQRANVVFMGGVGLGKSHLAIALAYHACLQGHRVLFASAADILNTLSAAQAAHRLQIELRKYLRPALLVIDELGFMPLDKHGADLLFQVVSGRYECGPIILTTNKSFKNWSSIFNNDSIVTSAILDRLMHHSEVVAIEGKSYRMKDRIDP